MSEDKDSPAGLIIIIFVVTGVLFLIILSENSDKWSGPEVFGLFIPIIIIYLIFRNKK